MFDSRRVLSVEKSGNIAIWLADDATPVQTINNNFGKSAIVSNNMKYVVSAASDNLLRIWSLVRDDERFTVNHSETITCYVITADNTQLITGAKDQSLKVWALSGGKLTQVLVGHLDQVTCVAVSLNDKTQVISGCRDSTLIVWELETGDELFTLTGHTAAVTCVAISADSLIAVSGSEDKSIIAWDTKKGRALSNLMLHVPVRGLAMATDGSRIAVYLHDSSAVPIVCLHNTPASYVKMPSYIPPAKDVQAPDLRPNSGLKRPMRRLLKKEVSLDTYTWQKKYGHLTSNIMMAAVDERLKRRFSVSASMEEISKLPNQGSQQLGPEQAALAQSQHFDQLEALWNKRSPPRRRLQLSKQNSRQSDPPTPLEEDPGGYSDE